MSISEAMLFLSNGRNESSPLGDSSGRNSASDENIFFLKTNNSQRQQSSLISVSSFGSEPEQVSSRPVAEKPVVPSTPEKKSYAADRSSVQNQGTPSEPNLKAPSASTPKRAAAAKTAKDDDDAEQQHEPAEGEGAKDDNAAKEQTELTKKSVSKRKEPAEAVPASNPMKKKPHKQPQESVVAVTVATPSAEESPQTSSKKTAHVWTDNDESVIMHGYLVCAEEGLEFPNNIPQLLDKINDSLSHQASKPQLYEKLRGMKGRYEAIKNKIDQENIKEDVFVFNNSLEKEMFKLWKHAWGEHTEGDEMEEEVAGDAMGVDPTDAVGDYPGRAGEDEGEDGEDEDEGEDGEDEDEDEDKDEDEDEEEEEEEEEDADEDEEEEEEEEEVESDSDTNTAKDPKTPNTEKALVSNHIPVEPEDMIDYGTIMKTFMEKTSDMLAEITTYVENMVKNSEAELRALLDSHLSSANRNRGTGGGSEGGKN